MKRAVITGLGIVSSIGNNQQEVLASLREGRSGITFSEEFKDSGMRSHVWGNVKLDTTGLIDRKVVRFMNDASIYAYLSMQEAIADAGLSAEVYQNNPRVGLIAGSGGSSKAQVFGADAMRSPRGLKAVGPYVVTKAMGSAVSACLATPFKIHGVNYSISSACATSAHCIGNAVEQIQLGKQDIVFAGGGEELCWEMACEFDAMGALSTKYNDDPSKASRTYDANRDGFVIAGGGGMVVVEELEHALKRGGDSILLVSSPTLFGTSWRSSAFSDYCLQHGVNLEHSTISADTSIRAGYELGKALVRSNRLKKVICCTYDMTALGLTTALSEENIVVGKDVEILTTSSSDDDLLAYSNPPITVVDLKFGDLCYMAMRLGMDIATGRASYPQEISLHPTIIYRKSCPA